MGHGGKRKGAGAKPCKPKLHKDGDVLASVGDRMDELTQELLASRSAKVRRWAWKQLLPYVYRKQPQAIEATGRDGANLFDGIIVTVVNGTQP